MTLSLKQEISIAEATKRINVWVGAVRSGKTHASLKKLIFALRSGIEGDVMIIGVNRDSIQRNILNLLYKELGFDPPGLKTSQDKIYGRNVFFVGAHDESAVRRIQGSTLAFAYVDEAAAIPEPFWRMLLSRLSLKGSQVFATCNPEGAQHWLKKSYLDNTLLDLASWQFGLDDNPTLTEDYKENLKREYGHGSWYQRLILGNWYNSSGMIWDGFDDDNVYTNPFDPPSFYCVGIDYGTSNATAAVLGAFDPKKWPQIRIEEEYYYDSIKAGRAKTDSQLADDIFEWLKYKSIQAIYVDPAAASFKAELRQRNLPVLDANNNVLDGLRIVGKFISHKNLVIHKGCTTLIEAIQSYIWDPKAVDRGEDKPLKKFDHQCDSARYLISSVYKNGIIEEVNNNITVAEARKQIYGDNENLWGNHSHGFF